MTAFSLQNYALPESGTEVYGISRYLSESPLRYRAQASYPGTVQQIIPSPVNRLERYVSGSAAPSTIPGSPPRTDAYLPAMRTRNTIDIGRLARSGVLRDQLIFSRQNLLSSSLGGLAGRLETTIRQTGGPVTGERQDMSVLRRAADLYRRAAPSLIGQGALLEGTNFIPNTPVITGGMTAAVPEPPSIPDITRAGRITTGGDVSLTARFYRQTGSLEYQAPRLLMNLFA